MKYKEIMWGRWILLAMVIYGVLQPREFIDFFSDGTGLFLAYAITFSVLTYAFVLFNDDYWTRGANLFVLFLLFFLCKFFFSENINEIINLYFFSDLTIYSILIVLISFYHLVMWSYRKK
ncbi:MAG: hypothetical protein CMP02_00880 [Woeseiaceae bacterium]|nr:hypothetical protein [Woeseiaceae bacterium]